MSCRVLIALMGLSILLATHRICQAAPQSGLLIGVGQLKQSSSAIESDLLAFGYSDTSIMGDQYLRTWSLGYRDLMTRHWSVDFQLLQQGKTGQNVELTLVPGKTDKEAAEDVVNAMPILSKGISAIALYHYPLSKKIDVQAGGGTFIWSSKRTATVGMSSHTSKRVGVSAVMQLGLSYPISSRIRLEGYWQRMFIPDEPVNRVGLGLSLEF